MNPLPSQVRHHILHASGIAILEMNAIMKRHGNYRTLAWRQSDHEPTSLVGAPPHLACGRA